MNLLQDITIGAFVSRLVAMVLYSGVLGLLLAILARLLGDPRPKFDGRLTLNPFAHMAPSGVLLATLFGMGWIRPMRYDGSKNRWGKPGVLLVLLGGLLLSLLTLPLVDILRRVLVDLLPLSIANIVIYVLMHYQQIAVGTAALNLLPLPGLVCGAIWPVLRPDREKRIMRKEPVMLAVVAAAIVAGFISNPASWLLPYFSSL